MEGQVGDKHQDVSIHPENVKYVFVCRQPSEILIELCNCSN